mmetsp:Transcript_19679/g.60874  ORF Transcript_19679/g.60874 Transcript_19679/m.60874 type:complete len:297 (-) Transcript_19679:106-996(-)
MFAPFFALLTTTALALTPSLTRRAWVSAAAALTTSPRPALALDLPLLKKTPRIPTCPRQTLNRDFAVLLMRSGYNVTDDLDFVPMDAFQRDFFLRRQNAWESYRKAAPRFVTQGELSDPYYFDFVSFAQYDTINFELQSPRSVFEELRSAEGRTELVIRANGVRDDALARAHDARVGDAILNFIAHRASVDVASRDIERNVRQLFKWFVVLGFAADFDVVLDKGPTLQAKLLAPANLWSLQALKGQQLTNDFAAKALAAYLRRNPLVASFDSKAGSAVVDGATSTLLRSKLRLLAA